MRSATLIVAGSALFVGRLHAVLSLVSRSPQARLHYCDYSPSNCLLSSSALLMSEAEKGGRAKSINGQNGSFSNFSSPMKEEAKNGSNAVEVRKMSSQSELLDESKALDRKIIDDAAASFQFSPALSFKKFLTMQVCMESKLQLDLFDLANFL